MRRLPVLTFIVALILGACGGHNALPTLPQQRGTESTTTAYSRTGTIDQLGTLKFHANFGGGCGYDWVSYTASTPISGTLKVGVSATVQTNSTCAATMIATAIAVAGAATPAPTVPASIAQTHVLTACQGYGYNGVSSSVSISTQAGYCSWAQTGSAYAAAYRAAGIKVDGYTNYFQCFNSDYPLTCDNAIKPGGVDAAAATKQSNCSTVETIVNTYGTGYQSDPRTAAAIALAKTVAGVHFSGTVNQDALFSDDTASSGGLPTTPCNYSASAWINGANAVNEAVGNYYNTGIFVNSLNAWTLGANDVAKAVTVSPSRVLGAMCEQCFVDHSGAAAGSAWVDQQNTAVAVTQTYGKIFWAYPDSTASANTANALRTYSYASFLIAYAPGKSMYEDAYVSPNHFSIMPESGIVPTSPAVTATANASTYKLANGLYARAFGACYYRGRLIGACEAIVNPTAGTLAIPPGYAHQATFSGYDVASGGSAAFTAAAPTSLASKAAAVLFK